MSRGLTPRVLLATAIAVALAALGPAAWAADPPTPSPSAAPGGAISASTSTGSAKPGESIVVTGSGWPARITIQASTCGNNAIGGASDCIAEGAGSTVTDAQGNFRVDLPVGKPPKPCPCVIHVVSPDTTATVDQPFVVVGQPVAPLDQSLKVRTLTATSKLTGGGPLTAWFGGAAKRTYQLTVKNTGNVALTNPGVTLTVGKGADPTALLASPDIGTVQPGQTITYKLPITLKAPAFGQYRVKAYFSDLGTPASTTAATSSYPWAIIVLLWLLLQPLLLGLYRRRPVAESGPEDPFAMGTPAPGPLPIGSYATVAAGPQYADDPLGGHFPNPAAVGAPVGAGAIAYGLPVGAAIAPRPPSALVPNYRPVFGVTDLRSYLDPAATGTAPTVAPRIVLGGIVPSAYGVNGSNGINGTYDPNGVDGPR